ncbi:MAG TPA: 2-oxoacid:acceptor oxidoreductase family protein, partial [Armatimonadota bacterium]
MLTPAFNILIGGQAGQGLVTIGQILAKSLVRAGYFIVVTQSYQSRIRGGHNSFAIRVSQGEIAAPSEKVDMLLALDADSVTIEKASLASDGVVLVDASLRVDLTNLNALSVPYGHFASQGSANIAALGTAACLIGLDREIVSQTISEFFAKHPTSLEENLRALEKSYEWAASQTTSVSKLTHISQHTKRMTINGNEAIALGAISAGMKFCAFYPMTPATSISTTLAGHAKKMGLVIEQAEDEIAAINMALGASFCGTPSMTATSGGGFALMTEGVSLAAMTETPIVVVVSQRPGPATSMPTRTEQADIEFVLHSGHGEFPRAILAPGTAEECFYLTRK